MEQGYESTFDWYSVQTARSDSTGTGFCQGLDMSDIKAGA